MANARLPTLEMLTDGSHLSVLIDPKITGARRDALIAAARRGADLDEDWARYARVIEYDVPGRFFWPLTVVRSLRGTEVAGRCPVLGCSVHEGRLGDPVTGAARRAGP